MPCSFDTWLDVPFPNHLTRGCVVEPQGWSEDSSQTFIRLGEFVVPSRELQMEAICALLPEDPGVVVWAAAGHAVYGGHRPG